MALYQPSVGQGPAALSLRILLIVATVVVLMLVATAIFGWHPLGVPSLDISPDPLGSLRF